LDLDNILIEKNTTISDFYPSNVHENMILEMPGNIISFKHFLFAFKIL